MVVRHKRLEHLVQLALGVRQADDSGRKWLVFGRRATPLQGRSLGVSVNDQDFVPAAGQGSGKAHGERGFACPTFLIRDGDDACCHATPLNII